MKIYYNPKLKMLARKLRNNSTRAEIALWQQLKGRKVMGYQFMRQKPISNYIVDFFCDKLKLVIEVDGDSHNHEEIWKADQIRQKELEELGLKFLRFTDEEVLGDSNAVREYIEDWISNNNNPLAPFEKGEYPMNEGNPSLKRRIPMEGKNINRGKIPLNKGGERGL